MKRSLDAPLALILLFILIFLGSCGNRVQRIEDTSWEIQSFWDGQGLTKIFVTFNEDGSLTYSDDSSGTYSGSWSSSGNGNVSWRVDAPGRLPSYRATYDNRKIEGTAEDLSGDTAILTGDEQ
ncbi:MAG: hypothetical protein AAGN35_11640 [Bacteroidota bacterium]